MTQSLFVTITGNVQGVGLRFSVREKALELSLTGCVKNNSDGTVSAMIQGEESAIQQFLSWLEEGEYSTLIKNITRTEQIYDPTLASFEIRF